MLRPMPGCGATASLPTGLNDMRGRHLFMLIALFVATPVFAGFVNVPADVSVGLTVEPNSGLITGQPVTFTIAVTNHGPDPVNSLLLVSSDFVDEFDLSFGSTNCPDFGLIVTDGKTFHYNFLVRPTHAGTLAVGETRICQMTQVLSSQAPDVWSFAFEIPFFYIDLNPANNIASVTLRRATAAAPPAMLPTLSVPALLALASLLLLMGWTSLRGNGRSTCHDQNAA